VAPASDDDTSPGAAKKSTTGSGSSSGAASGPLSNRVALLQFGRASKKLRDHIKAGVTQAGLQTTLVGNLTKARMDAFLASPLVKLLSVAGITPAGQAFGAQLVNVTPAAQQAFPVLLGKKVAFVPVLRVVLTRSKGLTTDQAKLMKGVALGLKSTGIPLAYAERENIKNTKKSYVKWMKKLDVLTVDDVDTAAGKLRLGRILLGQITTQDAVDAVKVQPASATTDAGGSAGATPWVLLAVLLGGVAFMASGVIRRRAGGGTAT
jgi:hypothetical protein